MRKLNPVRLPAWLGALTLGGLVSGLLGCQASPQMNSGVEAISQEREHKEVPLIVGTYNTKGSEGIYGLSYHTVPGRFSAPKLLARADNPSFMALDADRLYVVNETGDGQVTTYHVSSDGALRALSSSATYGASPCFVALSPDGQFVATANYMGGNISIFSLDEQRIAQENPLVLQHYGRGANEERQTAPHAHWVKWDERNPYLYAVDLGIDEVRVYDFDQDTGQASKGRTALHLEPGDGPRHMFFHPEKPLVYILNELSNTITVAEQERGGSLREIQRVDTLPQDFTEHSQAGHIFITSDGQYLYASNRGHDSIAVFAIADNGGLALKQLEPTGGQWPRHFLVLEEERTLIVANQESHNIVAFGLRDDGTLQFTGAEVALPQATFIERR